METLIGTEGSEEGNIQDNEADKFTSDLASAKQDANPVVYKLVRVDFDGRLVPATDDELMEVEHFFDHDNSEMLSVADVMQTTGCGSSEDGLPKKLLSGGDEGFSQYENSEVGKEHLNAKIEGEINLEKLTIRELQETFRATFGRRTSVKDKQWLKRRIAMGLANSCEIPLTSFIIKDNLLVKKVEDANSEKVDNLLVEENGVSGDAMKEVPFDCDNKIEDASSPRLRSLLNESDSKDNSPIDLDQRAGKRVRKPTKRYIEELSDMETRETVGRLIPSAKDLEVTKDLSKSAVSPPWGIRSSAIVMRPDSLGGSGVQVPCVSRIRRCRPRKGIIALTPSSLEAELVRNATGVGSTQHDNVSGQKIAEARAVPFADLPSDEEKSGEQCSQIDVAEMAQEPEPKSAISSGNNSSSDFTSKGGMRRKHHRAWSLSEVVKLVDGVSRYGAGRWSEIKRISFASYSHRTSVDLKDKWRNLLKASFAAMSSDKGMNHQRKPTSMPIPTPILLKVRELAEMNGQAPRNFKASSGNKGTSVNEK